MFTGILNAACLGAFYYAGLVPFIEKTFPDSHRLYQDNDPKHASNYLPKTQSAVVLHLYCTFVTKFDVSKLLVGPFFVPYTILTFSSDSSTHKKIKIFNISVDSTTL